MGAKEGRRKTFQSTPPVKAATCAQVVADSCDQFQSTPPVKAATGSRYAVSQPPLQFQSTPPVKAATCSTYVEYEVALISIHAAREGGDPVMIHISLKFFISIHAAREGGDRHPHRHPRRRNYFNPRRP